MLRPPTRKCKNIDMSCLPLAPGAPCRHGFRDWQFFFDFVRFEFLAFQEHGIESFMAASLVDACSRLMARYAGMVEKKYLI